MSEFNEPPKPGWAEFHRGCGWFLFVLGGIGFVMFLNASDRSDKGAAMQLLILGIGGGITSFFAAFLIDVLTDMRHYLQSGNSTLDEMNYKLTVLATGQLKIEAEAEAAARVASVAEAKALAEKQAAEAKPATEKRLEWTGKAMQRAGFKEETLKRALTQGGTVLAWGDNELGQTSLSRESALRDCPVLSWVYKELGQTSLPLSAVVAIAAGGSHTVALKQDGTVVAWGYNNSGQTTVPAGLSGVVAIDAGDDARGDRAGHGGSRGRSGDP